MSVINDSKASGLEDSAPASAREVASGAGIGSAGSEEAVAQARLRQAESCEWQLTELLERVPAHDSGYAGAFGAYGGATGLGFLVRQYVQR